MPVCMMIPNTKEATLLSDICGEQQHSALSGAQRQHETREMLLRLGEGNMRELFHCIRSRCFHIQRQVISVGKNSCRAQCGECMQSTCSEEAVEPRGKRRTLRKSKRDSGKSGAGATHTNCMSLVQEEATHQFDHAWINARVKKLVTQEVRVDFVEGSSNI
eukprot:151736-Amphidinium_carterae.1